MNEIEKINRKLGLLLKNNPQQDEGSEEMIFTEDNKASEPEI